MHGNKAAGRITRMDFSTACVPDTRTADVLPALTYSLCHHIDCIQSLTHEEYRFHLDSYPAAPAAYKCNHASHGVDLCPPVQYI